MKAISDYVDNYTKIDFLCQIVCWSCLAEVHNISYMIDFVSSKKINHIA